MGVLFSSEYLSGDQIRAPFLERLRLMRDDFALFRKDNEWKKLSDELSHCLPAHRELAGIAYAISHRILTTQFTPGSIPLHEPEHKTAFLLAQTAKEETNEEAPDALCLTVLKAALSFPKALEDKNKPHNLREAQACAAVLLQNKPQLAFGPIKNELSFHFSEMIYAGGDPTFCARRMAAAALALQISGSIATSDQPKWRKMLQNAIRLAQKQKRPFARQVKRCTKNIRYDTANGYNIEGIKAQNKRRDCLVTMGRLWAVQRACARANKALGHKATAPAL